MVRPTTILALLILAGSVFGLFQVKYRVQALQRDLVEVDRQLAEEKNARHVLKAEWAYLNQPDRLRTLVERHLQLRAITVAQLQNDIPAIDPSSDTALAAVASPSANTTLTAQSNGATPSRAPIKVASIELIKPAQQQSAKRIRTEKIASAKPKAVAVKESRQIERLATNLPPLYPNMDSLIASLPVSQ